MDSPLTKREQQVYVARTEGKTFASIGRALGISGTRASQLHKQAEKKKYREARAQETGLSRDELLHTRIDTLCWFSTRIEHVLGNANLTLADLLELLDDNRIFRYRNFGRVCYKEVCAVLVEKGFRDG
jgi:DNA-directed RNA polymerase alpha subunit